MENAKRFRRHHSLCATATKNPATPFTYSGLQCELVDECAANSGKGDCEHTCTDTPTSFQCSCDPGYVLVSATECDHTCDVADPCANGAACAPKGTAPFYTCDCATASVAGKPDYTFTGEQCELVNECAPNNGKGVCADRCVDTLSGFLTV